MQRDLPGCIREWALGMKLREMLGTILNNSRPRGTFVTPELVRQAKTDNLTGIAAATDEERELYLAIIGGEIDGAIIIEEKGELFGDKAIMLITGTEQFTFYDVDKEIVEAVAMGCRVFDKSHLRTTKSYEIPEIGTRSSGIGNLTLVVQHDSEMANGIRVSIRKDGKIVGSDITTGDGSVGFRVMHGEYDVVLQDRSQMITTRRITFSEGNSKFILTL